MASCHESFLYATYNIFCLLLVMVDASAISVAHIDVQGGRGYVWDAAGARGMAA